MKNIFLIILLSSCLGCDGGKRTYTRLELINSTNHWIELRSYNRINPEEGIKKLIQIEPSGEWTSIEFETTRGSRLEFFDDEIFGADSLIIVFDGNNYISNSTFSTEALPNLFFSTSYQRKEYGDHKTALRYIFTESDYENAIPIPD